MSERIKGLLQYFALRLLLAPLSVILVASIVFWLLRLTPGDPVDVILGAKASPELKATLRQQLGLTGSLWEQYLRYGQDLLQLNLGQSLNNRATPVGEIIKNFFPATAELAVYAMVIALTIGVGLGLLTAQRGNLWQGLGRIFSIVTYSLPLFWVGMLLQLSLGVNLGWFPIGTRFPVQVAPPVGATGLYSIDALLAGDWPRLAISCHYLALPTFTLGLGISGIFERVVRVNLGRALQSDFVEAAKARGIAPTDILLNHALRNALIPLVTIGGLTIAALLGGAVLTEVTFSFPGLANRLFEAIVARDYPVVQGIVIFFAVIVVIASISIDLINGLIDPRIRY